MGPGRIANEFEFYPEDRSELVGYLQPKSCRGIMFFSLSKVLGTTWERDMKRMEAQLQWEAPTIAPLSNTMSEHGFKQWQ